MKRNHMKKVVPLGRNVLVKVAKNEKTTQSGIVIPDTASEEKSQEGVVVAVGSSEKIDKAIKKGVTVIFKKYAGNEIEISNEEHVLLDSKDDILAIVD